MDDRNFSVVTNFALDSFNLVKKIQKEINKKYNIHADNLFYVLTVYSNEGLNQEKIGEILWVNKSKVARTLNTLEDEGFVERRQDRSNRRQNNIYTTPKGKKVFNDTMDLYKKIVASIDADEFKSKLNSFVQASLSNN